MSDQKNTPQPRPTALRWRDRPRLVDGGRPRGRHGKSPSDDGGADDAPRKATPVPINQRLGYRPAEFAALCGISYPTVWRRIKRGEIKTVAAELGIEPFIVKMEFGTGTAADNERRIIATTSNVGFAEMDIASRRKLAVKFCQQGLTQEATAKLLGVSQSQIQRDLSNLPAAGNSPRAKTASNPKGAGRPRGSGTKPKTTAKPADKPRAETAPQPAKPVADGSSLIWQSSGDTHRAQRGGWNYFIRRQVGRQFGISISRGHSIPESLDVVPSLEQAKAHCAEHEAAHHVSDAAEIERLWAHIAALEAAPPKPPKPPTPPLDPESAAARQIKALQTRVNTLTRQLNSKDQREMALNAPFTLRGKIAKALSEQHTSPEARLAALQAWNGLGANNGSKTAQRAQK